MAHDIAGRLDRGEIILMDGATITELYDRGAPHREGAESSGPVNIDDPGLVRDLHREYIEAGAQVITTNTFGAGRADLAAIGLGDRFEEITQAAVSAALDARAEVGAMDVAIAGSIACVSRSPLLDSYGEFARLLADAGAELIVLEMVGTVQDGRAAIAAAKATGLPVWAGVSVVPGPGQDLVMFAEPTETLRQAAAVFAGLGVDALTVMHSEIEDVEAALEIINDEFSGPVGAYPHRGTWEPPVWRTGEIAPDAFAAEAMDWIKRGAQLVGGCCGIGPRHIAAIAEALSRRPAQQRS